jgi:hypothetical protein
MRRSAGTEAPWFIRQLCRAEEHFRQHCATGAEYRRRFGSCMQRRRRDASMAEQGEALVVAWLFMVLQWLVHARITGR